MEGIQSTWSYFLDRKLDLSLNSFETKANAVYNARPMSLLFTKFYIARESNDRQTFDRLTQSNSKLVSAKHWTYQTLNEYINGSVMILPIEKYKLLN